MEQFIECYTITAQFVDNAGTESDRLRNIGYASAILLAAIRLYPDDARVAQCKLKLEGLLAEGERLKSNSKVRPRQPGQPPATEEEIGMEQHFLSKVIASPGVQWDDVAGLEVAKGELSLAVILPQRQPHLFAHHAQHDNILLYGPPGTGKTMLGAALATAANATFMSISSSDLISKWQGESERLISKLFDVARRKSPTVLFIDEIDSICGARTDSEQDSTRRVKTELLKQMDGIGNNGDQRVCVLGATNTPWTLDTAFLRRFRCRIYIPLPDSAARASMIGKGDERLTPDQVSELVTATDGYSASDVSALLSTARNQPLRECQRATHFELDESGVYWQPSTQGGTAMKLEDVPQGKLRVQPAHFTHYTQTLTTCKSTIKPDALLRYAQWTEQFGREG